MTKKKTIYMIDGKPTKMRDFKGLAQDTLLKEALGDYISAKDAYRVGIKDTTLRSWRNSRKIRAKKAKSMWYYSRQDLLKLLRASK